MTKPEQTLETVVNLSRKYRALENKVAACNKRIAEIDKSNIDEFKYETSNTVRYGRLTIDAKFYIDEITPELLDEINDTEYWSNTSISQPRSKTSSKHRVLLEKIIHTTRL